MGTVTTYTTLHDSTPAGLDTQVAAALLAGGQPYGNPYWDNFGGRFTQVVTNVAATSGTVNSAISAYVTPTEQGDAVIKTKFVLSAFPLTMTDAAAGGGIKLFTFPKGRILRLAAAATLAMTTTSTIASTLNSGVTCNYGLGSTTQANGTLATTEQDIIQTTNITSSTTINVAAAAANGVGIGVLTPLDGTVTPISAFLNVGVATNTDIDGDATVLINGTIWVIWGNAVGF